MPLKCNFVAKGKGTSHFCTVLKFKVLGNGNDWTWGSYMGRKAARRVFSLHIERFNAYEPELQH